MRTLAIIGVVLAALIVSGCGTSTPTALTHSASNRVQQISTTSTTTVSPPTSRNPGATTPASTGKHSLTAPPAPANATTKVLAPTEVGRQRPVGMPTAPPKGVKITLLPVGKTPQLPKTVRVLPKGATSKELAPPSGAKLDPQYVGKPTTVLQAPAKNYSLATPSALQAQAKEDGVIAYWLGPTYQGQHAYYYSVTGPAGAYIVAYIKPGGPKTAAVMLAMVSILPGVADPAGLGGASAPHIEVITSLGQAYVPADNQPAIIQVTGSDSSRQQVVAVSGSDQAAKAQAIKSLLLVP